MYLLMDLFFPQRAADRYAATFPKATDAERLECCKDVFKIGEVCRLRSGGPLMTVSQWCNDDVLQAEWFDGNTLMRGVFHAFEVVLP